MDRLPWEDLSRKRRVAPWKSLGGNGGWGGRNRASMPRARAARKRRSPARRDGAHRPIRTRGRASRGENATGGAPIPGGRRRRAIRPVRRSSKPASVHDARLRGVAGPIAEEPPGQSAEREEREEREHHE